MKNPFKRKEGKGIPKPTTPREMPAITQEYTELCSKAGDIQYKILVLQAQLRNINDRVLAVDQEASGRNALDIATKAAQSQSLAPVETSQQ